MYVGERFNSISHLIGLLLAFAGSGVLLTLVSLTGDPWKITSSSVFAGAMIFLYGFSTLYHSLKGSKKEFFQKLDYIAIYLMIAGTYTPFTLVNLRGESGWWIFGIIWSLAIFGIAQELLRKPSPQRKLSLVIYLVMGWLAVLLVNDMQRYLSSDALFWLVFGGLAYTVGALFYALKRVRYTHAIWHIFVLIGAGSHFLAIYLYVI